MDECTAARSAYKQNANGKAMDRDGVPQLGLMLNPAPLHSYSDDGLNSKMVIDKMR